MGFCQSHQFYYQQVGYRALFSLIKLNNGLQDKRKLPDTFGLNHFSHKGHKIDATFSNRDLPTQLRFFKCRNGRMRKKSNHCTFRQHICLGRLLIPPKSNSYFCHKNESTQWGRTTKIERDLIETPKFNKKVSK